MSRSSRTIPKEIAAFGERQFMETGAERVEVLRVKTSTIRKMFKKLSGITYIVTVISLNNDSQSNYKTINDNYPISMNNFTIGLLHAGTYFNLNSWDIYKYPNQVDIETSRKLKEEIFNH